MSCSLFSVRNRQKHEHGCVYWGRNRRKFFSGDFSVTNPPVKNLEKLENLNFCLRVCNFMTGKQAVTYKAKSPQGNLALPFQLWCNKSEMLKIPVVSWKDSWSVQQKQFRVLLVRIKTFGRDFLDHEGLKVPSFHDV